VGTKLVYGFAEGLHEIESAPSTQQAFQYLR
jgi:hypothetical protein